MWTQLVHLQEFHLHNRLGRLKLSDVRGIWNSIAACEHLTRLSIHGAGAPEKVIPEEGFLSRLSHLTNVRGLRGH